MEDEDSDSVSVTESVQNEPVNWSWKQREMNRGTSMALMERNSNANTNKSAQRNQAQKARSRDIPDLDQLTTDSGQSYEKDNHDRADDWDQTSPQGIHTNDNGDVEASSEEAGYYKAATERYKQHLVDCGYNQSEDSVEETVQRYVNKRLFAKVKFITCPTQMEFDGELAKKILSDLKVAMPIQKAWWKDNQKYVSGGLRMRRNNVGTFLKAAFMSKHAQEKLFHSIKRVKNLTKILFLNKQSVPEWRRNCPL